MEDKVIPLEEIVEEQETPKRKTEGQVLEEKILGMREEYMNAVMRHLDENFNPALPEGQENSIKTGAILILWTEITNPITMETKAFPQMNTTLPKDHFLHVMDTIKGLTHGNS